MPINLEVLVDSPEYEIDMKSGLETLQGVSDATRCIAEALVTGKVPQRQRGTTGVRTILKRTFKGSYGQIYSVEMGNDQQKAEYRKIGNAAFAELMAYFMNESLYKDSPVLSEKAQKVLDRLGDVAEKLVRQLRVSSMENIHQISVKFNYPVQIRYRKSLEDRIEIAKFNRETVLALQAKESVDKVDLVAGVTRLNINTGNGRLLLKGAEETVAFGFGIEYKSVRLEAKKVFSENLNFNNGLEGDKWKYLRLSARPVRLRDGRIVKYIVTNFYED